MNFQIAIVTTLIKIAISHDHILYNEHGSDFEILKDVSNIGSALLLAKMVAVI